MKRSFTKYPSTYVRASIERDSAMAYIVLWIGPSAYYPKPSKQTSYFSTTGEALLEYKRWAKDIDNPNPNWSSAKILKVQYWRKYSKNGDFVLSDEKVSKDFSQ